MTSSRVTALLLGALWLCSCDLVVDKIREGATNNRPDNGNNAGNGSGGGSSGPTPPPTSDAGTSTACASTASCAPGLTCSTEWGVCNAPPGCRPGAACPAVCYGFCETGKGEPLPPPPPPPSRCQDWTGAGDETTCKSQGEWKQFAYEACQAQRLFLNDYGVGGGDCGPGMTRQVKYQCCAPSSVSSDPGNSGAGGGTGSGSTPGTGTPGSGTPGGSGSSGSGGSCTGGSEGGETSCKSVATWRQYATENCARQNLVLNDIGFAESCGPDLYRYMKFVCCTTK